MPPVPANADAAAEGARAWKLPAAVWVQSTEAAQRDGGTATADVEAAAGNADAAAAAAGPALAGVPPLLRFVVLIPAVMSKCGEALSALVASLWRWSLALTHSLTPPCRRVASFWLLAKSFCDVILTFFSVALTRFP